MTAKTIKCQTEISPHSQNAAKASTNTPIRNCVTSMIFFASALSTRAPPLRIKSVIGMAEASITAPCQVELPVSSKINHALASSCDHLPTKLRVRTTKKSEKFMFLKGAKREEANEDSTRRLYSYRCCMTTLCR